VRGPQAVLVDGYNVLHAVPTFAPRGRDLAPARDRFETWLAEAAARAGVDRCILIWDGRAAARGKRIRGIDVLYTAAGTSADQRILELCRGTYASRAATTWVVSSDGDVRGPARQLGFPVVGAMQFYRRWAASATVEGRRRGRRRDGEGAGDERPARGSRAEVDELLEAFLEADAERG
jgi:predicted RNA-binding protein with PIN domain